METNIITGFAVVNSDSGKKITYTVNTVDEQGNIVKSNVRHTFVVVDPNVQNAITTIEDYIKNRG